MATAKKVFINISSEINLDLIYRTEVSSIHYIENFDRRSIPGISLPLGRSDREFDSIYDLLILEYNLESMFELLLDIKETFTYILSCSETKKRKEIMKAFSPSMRYINLINNIKYNLFEYFIFPNKKDFVTISDVTYIKYNSGKSIETLKGILQDVKYKLALCEIR
jgi:hypothetical protein